MRNHLILAMLFLTLTSTNLIFPRNHHNNSLRQERIARIKNIKALQKRIEILTAKLEELEERTEEQASVLELKNKVKSCANMSNFDWKKFFIKVTSRNLGKASILIIALGTKMGLINPVSVLLKISGVAAKWICKALWYIAVQCIRTTLRPISENIPEPIKEAYEQIQKDYRSGDPDIQEHFLISTYLT